MATEPISEEVVGSCVDSHGSAIGMPQLCFDWFPNQIFWLVITLVVIFLVLSRVALPRIAAILAERQGTITNDLAAAEDLKAKAVEAEEAYNKALADARAEAQRIAAEARAEIQADLDDAIAKADAEIAFYQALVEHSLSIMEVHRRKGSLLDFNGVQLAEGPWPKKAYFDALNRARRRDASPIFNYGYTRPRVLSRCRLDVTRRIATDDTNSVVVICAERVGDVGEGVNAERRSLVARIAEVAVVDDEGVVAIEEDGGLHDGRG